MKFNAENKENIKKFVLMYIDSAKYKEYKRDRKIEMTKSLEVIAWHLQNRKMK